MSINSPIANKGFEDPPTFDLSITDSHFHQSWYSTWDGVNWSANYFFSGTTGTINQSLWSSLPQGTLTIRFFANDSLGNYNFSSVTVVKSVPATNSEDPNDQSPLSGISGYNLLIFICIIGLISKLYMRKVLDLEEGI